MDYKYIMKLHTQGRHAFCFGVIQSWHKKQPFDWFHSWQYNIYPIVSVVKGWDYQVINISSL